MQGLLHVLGSSGTSSILHWHAWGHAAAAPKCAMVNEWPWANVAGRATSPFLARKLTHYNTRRDMCGDGHACTQASRCHDERTRPHVGTNHTKTFAGKRHLHIHQLRCSQQASQEHAGVQGFCPLRHGPLREALPSFPSSSPSQEVPVLTVAVVNAAPVGGVLHHRGQPGLLLQRLEGGGPGHHVRALAPTAPTRLP